MLFKPSDFGKPISSELSDNLKGFTDKQDIAEVAIKTGLSTSAIRDIKYRAIPVTFKSAPAIEALASAALRNCESAIEKAKQARKFFQNQLAQHATAA